MIGHFLSLVAQQAPATVTTNPNTGDAWLGRAETVLLILGSLAAFYRATNARFHTTVRSTVKKQVKASVRATVKKEVIAMRDELRAHTDAEAGMVRDEVQSAIRPVTEAVQRLGTQLETLHTDRAVATRRNDADHEEFRSAIARLEHKEPA